MSMKNPLIPSGIEPATLRFVAQHLNHCATAIPSNKDVQNIFFSWLDQFPDVSVMYSMARTLCGEEVCLRQ